MGLHAWGAGACGCIDGAGVLALPEGGALEVQTDPAASGTVRLPDGSTIRVRNALNTADLDALEVTGDDLVLGGPLSGNMVDNAWLGATSAVNLNVNGSDLVGVTSVAAAFEVPVEFGATVSAPRFGQQSDATASATGPPLDVHAQDCTGTGSTGGRLNLRSGDGVAADGEVRVSAGTTTSVLSYASGEAILGGAVAAGARPTTAALDGASASELRVNDAAVVSAGSSLVTSTQPLEVDKGAGTPASSGSLRLPNGAVVRARNGTNNGDLDVAEITENDLEIGGPLVSGNRVARLRLGATEEIQLVPAGTTAAKVTSGAVTLATSNVQFEADVASPTITQLNDNGAAASGDPLLVKAQSCLGTNGVGGNVELQAGDGALRDGKILIKDAGGTARFTMSDGGDITVNGPNSFAAQVGGVGKLTVDDTYLWLQGIALKAQLGASVTRTLLWEIGPSSPNSGDHVVRFYRHLTGLEVTINASWNGSYWVKDVNMRSSRLRLDNDGELSWQFHNSTSSTFTEPAWSGSVSRQAILDPFDLANGEELRLGLEVDAPGPLTGYSGTEGEFSTNFNIGSGASFASGRLPADPSSATLSVVSQSGTANSPSYYALRKEGVGWYDQTSGSTPHVSWMWLTFSAT